MSNAPVNTGRVIKHIQKNLEKEIANQQLVMLAGGTHQQWSDYLIGPKVAAVVGAVNPLMAEDNIQLISCGVRSERWRAVSLAEAHMEKAAQNLKKIDNDYRMAHDHVLAVCEDLNAPKRLRREAKAWLELFEEPQTIKGLRILREWADDVALKIVKKLPRLESNE